MPRPRSGRRLSRPTRVGELLGASLPRGKGSQGALPGIVRAWPAAVGEVVARHAWPASMSGTELVAHAESSVWVLELQLLAGPIAQRLRETSGGDTPSAVRFRVGPVPDRDRAPEPPSPPIDEADRARARAISAAIGDDALRTAAERAIAGALARADSA